MVTTHNAPTAPFGGDKRAIIAHQFGRWTAFSAIRSGKHVKSGDRVYPALDAVPFTPLFDGGAITLDEFDRWHENAVSVMCQSVSPTRNERFNVSHAAKVIAVYLKTVCFLSGYGRPGLVEAISPPFDRALMKELSLKDNTFPEEHDHDDHMERVKVARREAVKRKCLPIELEALWRPDA
ncbi:MAG: hypothetical protein F4X64_02535 [Chloroflexi bacterium]|nr:hypothetical protein [Chloroflexota bacterium]